MKNAHGLTLLELLIVFAVVGILTKLALPAYERNKAKSLQAEAKLSLAGSYSMEKSFYSEYSAYVPDYNAIGYQNEGAKRWYFASYCIDTITYNGTIRGYSGGFTSSFYTGNAVPLMQITCLYANTSAVATAAGVPASCDAGTFGNDPQSFTIFAWGQLVIGSPTCDIWTIDKYRALKNVQVGY